MAGYLKYTVEFTAKVNEFTRHKINIPLDLRHVIE
jgi:hypothetical protein